MAKKYKGFIKILVENGIITDAQIADAESLAKKTKSDIATTLVQQEYATEEEVMRARAKYNRM